MASYMDTVYVDERGHKIVVHTPVRTAEQEREWLAGVDRAIREACPGRRLYAYRGAAFDAGGGKPVAES